MFFYYRVFAFLNIEFVSFYYMDIRNSEKNTIQTIGKFLKIYLPVAYSPSWHVCNFLGVGDRFELQNLTFNVSFGLSIYWDF